MAPSPLQQIFTESFVVDSTQSLPFHLCEAVIWAYEEELVVVNLLGRASSWEASLSNERRAGPSGKELAPHAVPSWCSLFVTYGEACWKALACLGRREPGVESCLLPQQLREVCFSFLEFVSVVSAGFPALGAAQDPWPRCCHPASLGEGLCVTCLLSCAHERLLVKHRRGLMFSW